MLRHVYQFFRQIPTLSPCRINPAIERTHDEHETTVPLAPTNSRVAGANGPWETWIGGRSHTDPHLASLYSRSYTRGGEYDTHVWGGCRWCCRLTVFFYFFFSVLFAPFFLAAISHTDIDTEEKTQRFWFFCDSGWVFF